MSTCTYDAQYRKVMYLVPFERRYLKVHKIRARTSHVHHHKAVAREFFGPRNDPCRFGAAAHAIPIYMNHTTGIEHISLCAMHSVPVYDWKIPARTDERLASFAYKYIAVMQCDITNT